MPTNQILQPALCNVQLDNIMLHGDWPRPILKICDFGYSKDEVGQSVSKSTCGTPEYMAPEVLFEEKVGRLCHGTTSVHQGLSRLL